MIRWFQSWLVTRRVRRHPDFAPQLAEYRRLAETGELFEGLDLTDAEIHRLQQEAFRG